MDDVPEEEFQKIKQECIGEISILLKRCNDVSLLDLLLKLLQRSI